MDDSCKANSMKILCKKTVKSGESSPRKTKIKCRKKNRISLMEYVTGPGQARLYLRAVIE